jgi:nucleotide-binding universal stress UspA family protein
MAMFALSGILVPSNLGEPSRAAVAYGVAFARQFHAKLFLLHALGAREFEAAIETERVIETLLPLDSHPQGAVAEPSLDDVARNAAREDLGRLLSAEEERDTRAEYLLRASGAAGPAEAIVACAKELGVELIVMGKHRVGLVDHFFAGSVAEKVLRRAPCPVLIVQHPVHDFVVPESP